MPEKEKMKGDWKKFHKSKSGSELSDEERTTMWKILIIFKMVSSYLIIMAFLGFFLGFIFYKDLAIDITTRLDVAFSFVAFEFLTCLYAIACLFIGVYAIWFVVPNYSILLNQVGLASGNWITWLMYYPIYLAASIFNIIIIIAIIAMLVDFFKKRAESNLI